MEDGRDPPCPQRRSSRFSTASCSVWVVTGAGVVWVVDGRDRSSTVHLPSCSWIPVIGVTWTIRFDWPPCFHANYVRRSVVHLMSVLCREGRVVLVATSRLLINHRIAVIVTASVRENSEESPLEIRKR